MYRQIFLKLPKTSPWTHTEIKWRVAVGDDVEDDKYEVLHLWTKDILQVIQELFENPQFKDHICCTPLKLYSDANKTERIYNEAWTGDKWHDCAVRKAFYFTR